MTPKHNWREFFPLPTPRPEQVKILDEATQHFLDGKRFLVLQAGTGVGKSAIAVCLSRWVAAEFPLELEQSAGGAIITSQKTLQDQYTHDFSMIAADLRSSANYPCKWTDGATCAEVGRIYRATGAWPCKVVGECDKGLSCPYKLAKSHYTESAVGITNYSFLMSEATYAGILKPRQLVILDECHRIEEEIRRWATVQVDESLATELKLCFPGDDESEQQVLDWLDTKYVKALELACEDAMQQLQAWQSQRGRKLPPSLRALAKLHEYLDKKKCQLNRWRLDKAELRTEYVLVRTPAYGDSPRSIELKPLDVASGAHDVLYSRGQRVLMMSATVLDFEAFSKTCGLPKDSTAYIDVQSPFDPKNFGLVYRPIAKMNKAEITQSLPRVVAEVRKILAAHPTEKGIIHVANYEVARAVARIGDSRLLVQTSSRNREEILKQHTESPDPTVLVSPAMMEGLDLHDDLGRFQVICKVPFPFLGDPVIKKLLERSQRWYAWRTALTMVQAVGRCVRNESDWTKTYILDECFGDLFMRSTYLFTEAFSKMKVEDVKGMHNDPRRRNRRNSR